MKTIIAGSRNIKDYAVVEKAVMESGWGQLITEVVSGTARGVDRLGEQWAARHEVLIKPFPADWEKYGKGAGLIRNKQMAQYAEALIAVWDGQSVGTKHMIETATGLGLKVYVYHYTVKEIEYPPKGDTEAYE